MPKRSRSTYTRRSKRRKTVRRPRRLRPTNTIVPASKVVKLRYVDFITLDPAAGTSAVRNIFRANSVFDPNQTGVGHQPLGFDQWSVFYDNYIVIGARCKATFMSQSTSIQGSAVVGVILTDSTASLPIATTIMEQPNSKFALMTNMDANQKKTVTKNFSAKKFFGLQSVKDNRATIGAAVTADPTEEALFSVYAASYDSAATIDPSSIKVSVTIDYIVMFTERKTLAAS